MRQLWQTGWMHNRVRMITASFLIKHLLIDWREGEKWFWDTLCDADYASNATNWQWTAGTGVDSNMFSRIMAPLTQSEKFDAARYIRTYVPELARTGGAVHPRSRGIRAAAFGLSAQDRPPPRRARTGAGGAQSDEGRLSKACPRASHPPMPCA